METRIELTETDLDVELALLTYDEMDAVAGGQSSASVDFNVSAAGVNLATVTTTLNISTSDTDGSKMASIVGTITSMSD